MITITYLIRVKEKISQMYFTLGEITFSNSNYMVLKKAKQLFLKDISTKEFKNLYADVYLKPKGADN